MAHSSKAISLRSVYSDISTTKPTDKSWYDVQLSRFREDKVADGYDFNMRLGPLKNATEKYHSDNFFWKEIIDHPNYDEFWQKRNILPAFDEHKACSETVGGLVRRRRSFRASQHL